MSAMTAVFTLILAATASISPLMPRIDEGRDMLRAKKYAEAEAILSETLEGAVKASDSSAAARSLFFLGLSKHEQADQATGEAASALRREAIRLYEQSLDHFPRSRSTLMNLAELQIAERNYDAARFVIQRAMEMDALTSRPVWVEQLGDLAAAQGKHGEAADRYADVLGWSATPSPALRQKFVTASIVAGKDPEDLIPHLWVLAKSERSDAVMDLVFDALAAEKLDRDATQALFGILAFRLARQDYTPSELSQIGASRRLEQLSLRPGLANGVTAIWEIYGHRCAVRDLFTSWPAEIDDDDVPRDLSPRHALGDLARTVGRRAYHERAYDRATQCLELAAALGHENDVSLYADLASVYFEQNRVAEIEPRLAQLEKRIEATAVSPGAKALYDYHRKVGSLYLQLPPDSNSRERFLAAARHLERSLEIAASGTDFRADANVKRLLGDVYARMGRNADSTRARLDAAAMFAQEGDFASAREMVSVIPPSQIRSDEERQRYGAVVEPLVTFLPPVAGSAFDPATVKGCIVVLSSSNPAAAREDAREKLQQMGVTIVGRTSGTVKVDGEMGVRFAMRTSG